MYLSQRFNQFPIPSERDDIIKLLQEDYDIQAIHDKFNLDKKSFYKKGEN